MQSRIVIAGIILYSCSFLFKFGASNHSLAIAGLIAISLILHSLCTKGLRLSNKVVLAFLVYVLFSSWQAIKPISLLGGVRLPYYAWLPIFMIFVYALMYSSIKKEAIQAIPCIVWVGFIASCYCLLQYLGIDQPMLDSGRVDNSFVLSHNVTAWFGHPVYAGCSIAMIIPLAIKIRKWFMLPFFVLAVLATKSDMAIGSMVCSLAALPFLVNKHMAFIGIALLLVICSLLFINRDKIKVNDNGRFETWSNMVSDIRNPIAFNDYDKKFGLFGRGLGSFKYMFHIEHPQGGYQKLQAHNEYLQVLYELGVIGLGFGVLMLGINIFGGNDIYIKSSLICVCLSALGIYVWQLGFTQFLTVFLLGLNKKD